MDGDNQIPRPCAIRGFSVAKRADTPNEDWWLRSSDGTVCAVSDGASVSFDPTPWARILTRKFVEDPAVSLDWLGAAIVEYNSSYDREAMQWMQQAAFDRGSFATLLGVAISADRNSACVLAVGDSLLAFVDNGKLCRAIPYSTPEEFDQPPNALCTNSGENRWLDETVIADAWHNLNLSSHLAPTLLLMTDALGRWLLEEGDTDRVQLLLELGDEQAFASLVEEERQAGRMRRDDTTLVVIGVSA